MFQIFKKLKSLFLPASLSAAASKLWTPAPFDKPGYKQLPSGLIVPEGVDAGCKPKSPLGEFLSNKGNFTTAANSTTADVTMESMLALMAKFPKPKPKIVEPQKLFDIPIEIKEIEYGPSPLYANYKVLPFYKMPNPFCGLALMDMPAVNSAEFIQRQRPTFRDRWPVASQVSWLRVDLAFNVDFAECRTREIADPRLRN